MTWKIFVHGDDPRWLSINNGGNDTLLETSSGVVDQQRAAEFAAWVETAREALEAIRDLPSQHDLLMNAEVRALYEIANRALRAENSQPEPQ